MSLLRLSFGSFNLTWSWLVTTKYIPKSFQTVSGRRIGSCLVVYFIRASIMARCRV